MLCFRKASIKVQSERYFELNTEKLSGGKKYYSLISSIHREKGDLLFKIPSLFVRPWSYTPSRPRILRPPPLPNP